MIAALVAAGCRGASADSTTSVAPLRPTEAQVCRGFGDKLLEGVTIDPWKGRADYLELREEPAFFGGYPTDAGAARPAAKTLGKRGVACAGATDKARCMTALRAIHAGSGFSERSAGNGMAPTRFVTYLIANFGDRMELVESESDLRRMLAPLDTTSDVELVAGCGRMLATKTGWEITKIYTDDGSCFGGTRGWTRFAMSIDGAISAEEDHTVRRDATCISGRRPAGIVPCAATHGDEGGLVGFFVESAYLEAASVIAFERLADELTELGAPDDLVSRARRSRDDEVRHADVMTGLVRDLGGAPRPLDVAPPTRRSAFEIARENAVEGSIRETFGALLAHYQARTAESGAVRAAMRGIAEDETRHASLAWDVAAWLEPRLSASERKELDSARRDALVALAAAVIAEPSIELTRGAGVPPARAATQLLASLATVLEAA